MELHNPSYPKNEVFPINMGEEADFDRIFSLYHAPLCRYCRYLTGVKECEDIVSEIFLALWRKKVHFESIEHSQAFLYRSAKNASLNFIRTGDRASQKHQSLGATTTESADDYLDNIIRSEVVAELYRAVKNLPSQCCKVITMSYLEGMSNQEIADELGLSIQSVKNYKVRGLGLLKGKLPNGTFILLLATAFLK
jgi:RNA polymerase sigma-70 factor (family 1)